MTTEARQGLETNELFMGISATKLAPLVAVAERRVLIDQQVLFEAGDRASTLYLIKDGAVSLELPVRNTRCGTSL